MFYWPCSWPSKQGEGGAGFLSEIRLSSKQEFIYLSDQIWLLWLEGDLIFKIVDRLQIWGNNSRQTSVLVNTIWYQTNFQSLDSSCIAWRNPCRVCNFQATSKGVLARHKGTVHDKIEYPCKQCGLEVTSKCSLARHKRVVHEGLKRACGQCDHEFTSKSNLLIHKRAVHEGMKHPCRKCDYEATTKRCLILHQKSIHQCMKYPCGQCNHKASSKSNLTRHERAVHKRIKYPCEQCNYMATFKYKSGWAGPHSSSKFSKF